MSSLAEYLAKNYLTADTPKKKSTKKRKRKDKDAAASGVIIADDDAAGWENSRGGNNSDDEDAPTVAGVTKASKKATTSNWKTISADDAEAAAAADAIIAANTDGNPVDDAPTIADDSSVIKMSSGAHAGLQTAEQVAAQIAKAQAEERRRFEAADPEESGKGQETIYRDASGRIINIAMQRAEARKKMQEEEDKKRKEIELRKGDVQKLQSAERAKQLEDAKYMTLARYADDKGLNEELKEQERWNDPAAAFLTKKKAGVSKTGQPLYQGAAPPNRFGIRPGHKWDGVDRGNGFEAKWFQAQNKKRERQTMAYTSQMDLD